MRQCRAPSHPCGVDGARIHILNISRPLRFVPFARQRPGGVDITGETCQHYLCSMRAPMPTIARSSVQCCKPAGSRKHHQDWASWQGLRDGTIDMIATDHAPPRRLRKLRNDS